MRATITTSDGFTATGRAADEASAAADYALLDEFTRFLEGRVFSLNLWLLRRLAAEYFCHCETSLLQMAAQGSTQIAVGPLLTDDASGFAEAQQMLQKRKQLAVDSGRSSSVFAYLATRLRTARLSLLMNFFVEFCQGKDDALCAFVGEGAGFVSILPSLLPVAVQPHTSSDGIAFESEEPLEMPPVPLRHDSVTPTHREKDKESRQIQPAAKALATASAQSQQAAETFTREQAVLFASMGPGRSNAAAKDYKMYLIAEVGKIEALRPWRKIYNSTSPPLPFDEAQYPEIAKLLRKFWVRHGQVVWERSFWVPHSEGIDAKVATQRKARQRQASTLYERIVEACFEQFGPRFFYKLDRERHPGWWYRGYCVDLVALAATIGPKDCLEYVEKQKYERFPDCGQELPLRSTNAGVVLSKQSNKVVSEALWVQSNKGSFEEIRRSYAEYRAKKQKKEAKKEKKKHKPHAKSQTKAPVVDKKPSREELRAASAARGKTDSRMGLDGDDSDADAGMDEDY